MRVDRVEVINFGPHRHTVLEPGPARLVVICGENGLGKTTIASEALGYALYGDVRGTVNGPVRNGQTDASVTVEFTFAGATYRAVRRRTTKGAGKSSADLHRRDPDGRWVKVASGDKEVPAVVRDLLRMDAKIFGTSVSLAQKKLDRFVRETSSGRKEALAAIVVDPRFKPGAERAGQIAREAEARAAADQGRLERITDAIDELLPQREQLERRRAALATAQDSIATASTARNAAAARIRELDVALAQADAIAAEITRAEADDRAARADWNAATRRRGVASANRILATNTVADADAVDAAVAALPGLRVEVERLTANEAQDRRLVTELREAEAAHELIDRPLRESIATWRTKRGLEEARIRELEEQARANRSVCATCGQPIDARAALDQLRAARARFTALGDEPKAPLSLARTSAAIQRIETRRRELVLPDPDAVADARRRLADVERTAARAEAIAGARATLEREAQAIAEADAELRQIEVRGAAIASRLRELRAQASAGDELRTERAAQGSALAAADAALEAAQDATRTAERSSAQAELNVARLEVLEAERAELDKSLKNLRLRIVRIRKVAVAFGLKGIPARMIETVLPELGRHANDVLSSLFGMTLEIRAQRAAADGKSSIEALDLVVRKDDVGEHELARISGGQETAVSLALAIGLSRLNARRAGTAIRTLVIDEPDGLDTRRLQALGEALRILAYQGELERIFVISHTTELRGYADQVIELREGPDGVETFIDGIRYQPDEQAAAAA